MQLLRLPPLRHGHQDRFLGPGRQEKASTGVDAGFEAHGSSAMSMVVGNVDHTRPAASLRCEECVRGGAMVGWVPSTTTERNCAKCCASGGAGGRYGVVRVDDCSVEAGKMGTIICHITTHVRYSCRSRAPRLLLSLTRFVRVSAGQRLDMPCRGILQRSSTLLQDLPNVTFAR